MELGLIIAIATLCLGLTGHIISTVWWASKITTVLEIAQKDLSGLALEVKSMGSMYTRKEDFIREIALLQRQQETMWTKFEQLKEKLSAHK